MSIERSTSTITQAVLFVTTLKQFGGQRVKGCVLSERHMDTLHMESRCVGVDNGRSFLASKASKAP